jgi:ketosteroid isomerase-like protein
MIVLVAVAAVLVYLYVPTPVVPGKQKLETTNLLSTSLNHSEELAIKEILVQYAHAMLFEDRNNYKTLFTSDFAKNNVNNRTIMPKASSVQISQPAISITSPNDARVRFTQIIRTSNNSRYSQERLLLKRVSTIGWRIDKRASQPVMKVISHMNDMSPDYNSFLYIKSEKEKQQDTKTIKEMIKFWADARAEADIEGVLTTYGRDIWERRGVTKEQWLEEFRNPKNVTITNVNVVFPSQDLAEVTLNEKIEDYTRQAYFDIHLILQLSDNGWLIADEDSKIVSEQILQSVVPRRLASIVKAEPISEPQPVSKTATIAKSEKTTTAGEISNNTVKTASIASIKPHETTAINNFVVQWKQAWSSKDIDAYLGYYSEKFVPKSGMKVEQWRQYRRIRLSKPKTIDIRISKLQIDQKNETKARVSFIQEYKSDLYQDKTRKTLILVRENKAWKIIREDTLPI